MTFQSPQMAERRSELLEDMTSHVAIVLGDMGIPAEVAEQCGCTLADHFADHWGGQIITFPKNHHHRLCARDLDIFQKLRGNNYHQLARDFNMSVRGIYKVIARVRQRGIDERQQRLELEQASEDSTGGNPK